MASPSARRDVVSLAAARSARPGSRPGGRARRSRQTGAKWAATQMKRTPAGDGTVPAKDLLPGPFTLREQDRPRGVYLHWALPDALTRGSQTELRPPAPIPPTPARLPGDSRSMADDSGCLPSRDARDRARCRGWILQAHDDNPQPIALDGRKRPAGRPTDSRIRSPLSGTAMSPWAGYFDNTENRLAFYDGLSDITNGPLAYLVCGWYSDPALDPLGHRARFTRCREFDARACGNWAGALPSGDLDESKAAAATPCSCGQGTRPRRSTCCARARPSTLSTTPRRSAATAACAVSIHRSGRIRPTDRGGPNSPFCMAP